MKKTVDYINIFVTNKFNICLKKVKIFKFMTNNKKNHISTHNYFIDKYLSLCNVLNMYPYI